jgi:hypothetical protein
MVVMVFGSFGVRVTHNMVVMVFCSFCVWRFVRPATLTQQYGIKKPPKNVLYLRVNNTLLRINIKNPYKQGTHLYEMLT